MKRLVALPVKIGKLKGGSQRIFHMGQLSPGLPARKSVSKGIGLLCPVADQGIGKPCKISAQQADCPHISKS